MEDARLTEHQGSISANLIINQLTPTPISLLDLSQTNVSVVRGSFAAELAQQVDAQVSYQKKTEYNKQNRKQV